MQKLIDLMKDIIAFLKKGITKKRGPGRPKGSKNKKK
jgi:hypothetical protein